MHLKFERRTMLLVAMTPIILCVLMFADPRRDHEA
jgi:hypothetical protein